MAGPERRPRPAAGVLNALIISAGFYGLLVAVLFVGGGLALLVGLAGALGLLHGCLTSPARSVAGSEAGSVTSRRSALL